MDYRTIVITGASSGIGFAAARQLAALGARIVMVSRDPGRGAAARVDVEHVATGPKPLFLAADLSSQRAIRSLSVGLHQRFSSIDVLINNAGTASAGRQLTVDGLERTFAVNHLGPFLLTELLLDLLMAAPAARVINTVSETHSGRLDFANLQGERRYGFFSAYTRSKLAGILFTYELARRLQHTNVTVNCFTPGPTATDFGRGNGGAMRFMSALVHAIGRSPDRSARTAVFLAMSTELAGVTGQYLFNGRRVRSKRITYDTEVASRLWAVSERLTHAADRAAISRPA